MDITNIIFYKILIFSVLLAGLCRLEDVAARLSSMAVSSWKHKGNF